MTSQFAYAMTLKAAETNAGPIWAFGFWIRIADEGNRADEFEVFIDTMVVAKILEKFL